MDVVSSPLAKGKSGKGIIIDFNLKPQHQINVGDSPHVKRFGAKIC